MPDLTMCINDDCPLAATCYRHEAKPTPGRQSFAAFKQNADGTCDWFFGNEGNGMSEQSKIEWTDHTFNPWEGCQKVAPECDNCYAEARDIRFTGGTHWGPKAPRRRTSAQNWNKPRKWNARAEEFHAAHGRRQRVFCASLADVFDNAVDPAWRHDLWALIRECDQMDWLLLTKRPQNMAKMLPPDWGDGWSHVWLGASAGSQNTAEQNIPHLLATPAALRFISAEPLLGPVELMGHLIGSGADAITDETGRVLIENAAVPHGIDWVICGGESGPDARPMHPGWARSLRDQCSAAKVPFFFKQWGEWVPHKPAAGGDLGGDVRRGNVRFVQHDPNAEDPCSKNDRYMRRIGKRAAGRLLDGREWSETPGPCT